MGGGGGEPISRGNVDHIRLIQTIRRLGSQGYLDEDQEKELFQHGFMIGKSTDHMVQLADMAKGAQAGVCTPHRQPGAWQDADSASPTMATRVLRDRVLLPPRDDLGRHACGRHRCSGSDGRVWRGAVAGAQQVLLRRPAAQPLRLRCVSAPELRACLLDRLRPRLCVVPVAVIGNAFGSLLGFTFMLTNEHTGARFEACVAASPPLCAWRVARPR